MIQKIKKNNHRTWTPTWPFLNPFKKYTLKFSLNDGMWYAGGGTGWNKVGGSSSILNHRKSFRVAWRPTDNRAFFITTYEYKDGERIIGNKMLVDSGTTINMELEKGLFKQNFYFGGKDTAPHDMWINVEYK